MQCGLWLTRVSKMDGHVPTVGSEQPPVLVEDVSAYFEVATMETTGGKVWDAARALLQFFRARPHLLEKGDLPLSLVELGSGTGFLGMSLARDFEVEMTLTEMIQGGALRWLERNVQRNLHVVFTMNPANADFGERAATSPALFNRCDPNP